MIGELKCKKLLDENPFPLATLDPREKSKLEYGVKVGKFIYYKGILSDITSDRNQISSENRDFATNRNDINKFKPRLDAEIDNDSNKSHLNISWDNQHPGKKICDTVIGDMINQDFKIQFNAIDSHSKANIQKDRNKYYAEIIKERDLAELEAESGVAITKKSTNNFQSKEEVDVFMELEYKQAVEMAMESIVEYELDRNNWEKIGKRVVRDLVENNIGGIRLYFTRNNEIKIRYVNAPLEYISSVTNEPDYSDVEYEAERILISISEIKRRDINNDISEEDLFKIAKKNSSKYGNASWVYGSSYNSNNSYNGVDYSYDDYRIEVLDFIYYTIDRNIWEERETKHKKKYIYKKKDIDSNGKNTIIKDIEMSYEGVWIVGTEKIIAYGRTKNILRAKKEGAMTPEVIHRYIIFQPNIRDGKSMSLIRTIIPSLETIQLLILRKRHIIAEMNPSGLAIDVSGLKDTLAQLGETDPLKLIKAYKQKGIAYYSRTDLNGDPANGMPIQELSSNFAQQLIGIDQSIIQEMMYIQKVSGINDARDGSSPDKNTLVGIEKMRLLASNNTTRELYQAYFDGIFSNIGRVMARMIQYKVEYGNGIKEYENIIGEQSVKSIEFAKDISMAELGIMVEALPTDNQIQDLIGMLDISLKNKEIRPEDYLEVKRVLNVKKAERLLIHRRKKYAEQQMAEFRQKEKIIAQRDEAAAIASAKAQQIKDESSAEAKIKIEREKFRLETELNNLEAINEMKKIDREYYWREKMLEKQLSIQDGNVGSLGIDAPRIMQDPIRNNNENIKANP